MIEFEKGNNPLSDYRYLINLTSEKLVERTKCYRRLVISIVIITLTSVCMVIGTISLWPLALLMFLIPAYSFFLVCDNSKLNKWRSKVIETWKSKAIDLNALRQAILVNQALPPLTIQGMLETLPDAGDLITEQSVSISTRAALADALMARDNNLCSKLIGRAVLHTLITATIISAVYVKAWMPLSALAIAPILLTMFVWLERRRISAAIDQVTTHCELSDFNIEKYTEIAGTVNWHGISSRDKHRLLMSDLHVH